MKATIKTGHLINAINNAFPALGDGKINKIEKYIKIEFKDKKGYVFIRNSEFQIETSFPCEIDEDHDICIPCDILINTLRLIKAEEVVLKSTHKEKKPSDVYKTQLSISGVKKRYNISGVDPSLFFKFSFISEDMNTVKIKSEYFKTMLSNIYAMVNPKDLRPAMACVCVRTEDGHITATATNSSIMGYMRLASDETIPEMIIPKRICSAIEAIPSAPDSELSTDGKQMVLNTGTAIISGLLAEGNFPTSAQINGILNVRDHNSFITVEKSEFIDSLKRLRLYSIKYSEKGNYNQMIMTLKEGVLELSGGDEAFEHDATEEVTFQNIGIDDVSIKFNPILMVSAIDKITTPKVRISLDKPETHIYLFEDTETNNVIQQWVIMPMR